MKRVSVAWSQMRREEKVRYQLMAAEDKRRYEQENQMIHALEKVPPVKSLLPNKPEDRKERSPPQHHPIMEPPTPKPDNFNYETSLQLVPQASWPMNYDHFLASEVLPAQTEHWHGESNEWGHGESHHPMVFHPEHMAFPAVMDASPWGFFGPQFTNLRGTPDDHEMPGFQLRGSNSHSQ